MKVKKEKKIKYYCINCGKECIYVRFKDETACCKSCGSHNLMTEL